MSLLGRLPKIKGAFYFDFLSSYITFKYVFNEKIHLLTNNSIIIQGDISQCKGGDYILKNKSENTRSRKLTGITVVVLIVIFAIGIMIVAPFVAKTVKERQDASIMSNLENIYTSAVIVDKIEGGLHNDSDNAGKYERLSELSGFRVYNAPEKKKYSLLKDYKTGEITVKYGLDIQYPKKADKENLANSSESGKVQAEDLFNYDESEGRVVITGFSQAAVSLLDSGSVIQIPSTYKGRDVVEIADKAFYNRNIMGTVTIPESIKRIGDNAFSNNGVKGISGNISKPYAGSWKVEEKQWVRVGE